MNISYKMVHTRITNNFTKQQRQSRKITNYRNSKLGDKNPMTNNPYRYNPISDSKGYLLVIKPPWYTGRKHSHHIFEHHYVTCEQLGMSAIPAKHVVHHCDSDKTNNDYSNLLLLTMSEHTALHQALGRVTTISKESTAKWLETYRASKEAKI